MEKTLHQRRLEYMNYRKGLTYKQQTRLSQFEKGFQGECIMNNILKRYVYKNWLIMHNVNLKTPLGFVQIDFLLISNYSVYILEVKNYFCDCHYKNHTWYINEDQELAKNISYQIRQSELHLKYILGEQVNIYPCILFVNEMYQAILIDQPDEKVVNGWQIPLFLSQIEPNKNFHITEKIRNEVLKYENTNADYFFMDEKWELPYQRGIYCARCYCFTLEKRHKSFYCQSCGFIEKKKECAERLIEECSVLFLEKYLTIRGVCELSGYQLNRQGISKLLSTKCKRIYRGRYTKYLNPYWRN